jgi:hypothetical protein
MPYDHPIAFMFTWSTYGTWLPGDARGWVEYRRGFQLPDPIRELESAARMTEDACILAPRQRIPLRSYTRTNTCAADLWLARDNCRAYSVIAIIFDPDPSPSSGTPNPNSKFRTPNSALGTSKSFFHTTKNSRR